MLGILAFVFIIVTVLVYLLIPVRAFLYWYHRPTNLQAIIALMFSPLFAGAAIFIFISVFMPQFNSYLFLKTLDSKDVTSINIEDVSWNNENDIHRIVTTLNQAVWRIPNHDPGGPFVDMTISLYDGSTFVFGVGRYNDKDAALVGQVFIRNYQPIRAQELYIPSLPATLENVSYSLPPAEIGYSTEPKDYLFLLGFMGLYIVALWPRSSRKKRSKSGPTQRARGRLDSHRFLAFSWLWVLSVSWVSLVPPAAGNASRWA